MPEAIVALGQAKRIVGRLRFEDDGHRQHSQFEYEHDWLQAEDGFALSPDLPLQSRSFFASGREDSRHALHGCFQDSAPDSWGRALMTRALDHHLTEFDYLTQSDDYTRQGALRFFDDKLQPLSLLSPPVPRLIELERLRMLAHQFEHDPEQADEAVHDLAGPAGSLGGTRPKASVVENGKLWIAKFTSRNDQRAVERAEVATLHLAGKCSLQVPEVRLELIRSPSPIALFCRFDRQGDLRLPYISAQTALGRKGSEHGYYTNIADFIRQASQEPHEDLNELWCRIIFTILVSNTDDHLKNHGFLYAGRGRWRLSPVFDINPAPARQRMLQTGIMEGHPFDASLSLALEAAQHFGLEPRDAKQAITRIGRTIHENWRKDFRAAGASSQEVQAYVPAFEHRAMEQALSLE